MSKAKLECTEAEEATEEEDPRVSSRSAEISEQVK
jgi:hypothetical protein